MQTDPAFEAHLQAAVPGGVKRRYRLQKRGGPGAACSRVSSGEPL